MVGIFFFVVYNECTKGEAKMFLGSFRHQIDQKNRMRIPTKFKQGLGSNFVITKGTNKCLFLLPENDSGLLSKIAELPVFDLEAQKSVRAVLSSAFEAVEDGQGRVLLPKELVAHAGIVKNIVFVGVGERVEIWAEENWDNYNKDVDFDAAAESLKKFGV